MQDFIDRLDHPVNLVCLLAFSLVGAYFGILIFCFNSFSLREAVRKYNARQEAEKKYDAAFKRREELQFHIDWAKSRGDHMEAKKLATQLEPMDKELDKLEEKLAEFHEPSKNQVGQAPRSKHI
mmetsp:Transcript_28/g.62  ORF Transcript_28/g.62 Transcript_28/m.62 type:complete len:124 (-) Transcript_28:326-697(-)